MKSRETIAITSRGIARISFLETLVGRPVVLYRMGRGISYSAVAGWGAKPTSRRARDLACSLGLPYIALEDGFLRSLGLGDQHPAYSLVVDDLGIYYDARRVSRLECLIREPISDDDMRRAQQLRQAWCAARVSKYNHAPDWQSDGGQPFVLVVDQTRGDASVNCGLASGASFSRMLECALEENPHHRIVIKVHPEVMMGRKHGYLDRLRMHGSARVFVLGEDVHPAGLIERADALYVVTSQMGFEGLLWNKRVRTFGMPFYAGWGLTEDDLAAPCRRGKTALENLIFASLIRYPSYVDPETGQRCEVERLVEWIGKQREELRSGTVPEARRGWMAPARPNLGVATRLVQAASALSRIWTGKRS